MLRRDCHSLSPGDWNYGEEYSEDDVSELIKEDEEVEEQKQQAADWKKCKKDAKGIAPGKKKQHRLFLDVAEGESLKDDKSDEEDGEPGESHKAHMNETEERKKEEALWASFLSDVGLKPKVGSTEQAPSNQKHTSADEKIVCKSHGEPKETGSNKITVTKVFDFAGEEVSETQGHVCPVGTTPCSGHEDISVLCESPLVASPPVPRVLPYFCRLQILHKVYTNICECSQQFLSPQ
ncbi:craniofacial development protein 1 isoform X5 [Erythrolamprus reginae]|uniref:craniofacial development protein 1 isoform X5 n=1 Tax=Erythrolamprus reginae TaxID=121349 RepID=UPI00396C800A